MTINTPLPLTYDYCSIDNAITLVGACSIEAGCRRRWKRRATTVRDDGDGAVDKWCPTSPLAPNARNDDGGDNGNGGQLRRVG